MRSIDELKDYVQSHSNDMFYETIDGGGRRARVVTCSEGYIIDLIEKVESEVKESCSTPSDATLFSQRVEEAVRNGEDVTLFGVDYMPFPVDNQGYVIRPGDSVYVTGITDPYEVTGVGRKFGETPAVWLSNGAWERASCIESHTTPPSPVEAMLREMCDRLKNREGEDLHKSAGEIVGEYATRLKLKETE
ncbi:MAG: hypothetical protein IKG21_13035 [Atopobiaceae bacterium]|nr:hypothetical protein [Atopobiaceae bacterium]MBR3318735.1 hypothetical protein [Atopobiaceae bacterium]